MDFLTAVASQASCLSPGLICPVTLHVTLVYLSGLGSALGGLGTGLTNANVFLYATGEGTEKALTF